MTIWNKKAHHLRGMEHTLSNHRLPNAADASAEKHMTRQNNGFRKAETDYPIHPSLTIRGNREEARRGALFRNGAPNTPS